MSDLFASPEAARSGHRPLADRLRPASLAEVTGQPHLTGPDGAITRMIASEVSVR
jgi:putative ATPase